MSVTHIGPPFPERLSTHVGQWVALYLEPLVGSGERVCVGVLATDGQGVEAVQVPQLTRLAALYGSAAESLDWAADLALKETRHRVQQHGIASIAEAKPDIDGISFGGIRQGAGKSLEDLARTALMQVSAFAAIEAEAAADTIAWAEGGQLFASNAYGEEEGGIARLVRTVRSNVASVRPELRPYFGRSFMPKQTARPLVFGFVGRRLAANFSVLTARSLNGLANQVDRAKARVLDLETLRGGKFTDQLALPRRRLQYELFVLVPRKSDTGRDQLEAQQSLEAQADDVKVQWRPFYSAKDMARQVMEREAA